MGPTRCTGLSKMWFTIGPVLVSLARVLAIVFALIVPVQGMAAVVAGQCMAFGHHQGDGESNAHAHDALDGHDHDSSAHAQSHATDEDQSAAHCGPCTACCGTASIVSAASLALPAERSEAQYFFFASPPLGVQPDGLFRPPLSL